MIGSWYFECAKYWENIVGGQISAIWYRELLRVTWPVSACTICNDGDDIASWSNFTVSQEKKPTPLSGARSTDELYVGS